MARDSLLLQGGGTAPLGRSAAAPQLRPGRSPSLLGAPSAPNIPPNTLPDDPSVWSKLPGGPYRTRTCDPLRVMQGHTLSHPVPTYRHQHFAETGVV